MIEALSLKTVSSSEPWSRRLAPPVNQKIKYQYHKNINKHKFTKYCPYVWIGWIIECRIKQSSPSWLIRNKKFQLNMSKLNTGSPKVNCRFWKLNSLASTPIDRRERSKLRQTFTLRHILERNFWRFSSSTCTHVKIIVQSVIRIYSATDCLEKCTFVFVKKNNKIYQITVYTLSKISLLRVLIKYYNDYLDRQSSGQGWGYILNSKFLYPLALSMPFCNKKLHSTRAAESHISL